VLILKYWLIAPHRAEEKNEFENAWNYDLEHNTIAISWYELGDPSGYQNIEELKAKLEEIYPDVNKSIAAKQIWDFYHIMKPDDILIARKGRSRIIGIGSISPNSEAYYDKQKGILRTGNNKKYSPNFKEIIWRKVDLEYKEPLPQNTLVEKDEIFYNSIIEQLYSFDKSRKTRVDEIIEAFEHFGGIAHYKDIEKYVRENTSKKIPVSLIHNIRGEIERKSSDSDRYDGTEDLFYAVGGKGNGIWGLREVDKELEKTSLEELRKFAYEAANDLIEASKTTAVYRKRSAEVKGYVLARAQGLCEGCNSKAPFINKEGKPYLETHHIYSLADGGPDDPRWVIALCPNCHRKSHHSNDLETFRDKLLNIVNKKENI